MIEEVIGDYSDEPVNFTILGRMSTGEFAYEIENRKTQKNHAISVTNSQCEIDGGFESENCLAIIEAKNQSVSDFIIRQLYYPYRLWKSKTHKEVIPIFLSISNDIFSFYRFCFTDDKLYNSIQLVSEHKYCISKSDVDMSDIRDILNSIEIIPDDKTPFPQADVFPRIIDLVGQLYATDEELSKDDITLMYAFDKRQTDYYVSAGIYLGLVERHRIAGQPTVYALSKHGFYVMSQHPQRRNIELVKCILKHRIFNDALKASLAKADIISNDEILSIMEKGNEPIATGSLKTRDRRAGSVRGWIYWILKLPASPQ